MCVCVLSQKPTPLIVTTAPSCFQELVAFPQAASNFLRALMIALRAPAHTRGVESGSR